MRIRIPEPRTWRASATRLYHFGEYRVPQDMPEDLARLAIDEGAAELVVAGVAIETKPLPRQTLTLKAQQRKAGDPP